MSWLVGGEVGTGTAGHRRLVLAGLQVQSLNADIETGAKFSVFYNSLGLQGL